MICPTCKRDGYVVNDFTEAINVALLAKNTTGRAVSRELGITNATTHRAFKGKSIGIDTLVKLCDWAGIDIEWAVRSLASQPTDGGGSQ